MANKRVGKYLMYALGEIVLVVIGILIAVNINNWNESSKQGKLLNRYLKAYKSDLELDTLMAGRALKMFDFRKKQFDIFLSDSVNAQTYKNNTAGYGLILSYIPFEMQTKGYNLLANYTDEKEEVVDSLLINIVSKHRAYFAMIESTQKLIKEDISETMTYLKNNQPWTGDMLQGDLSDPAILDYYLSKQHKSRVAVHEMLVIGNMSSFVNAYKEEAKKMIADIEKRLADN